MRAITEKTLITALVNYKCVGKFGLKGLSKKEVRHVIDTIIDVRGWIDERMNVTPSGDEVVKQNINLLQY